MQFDRETISYKIGERIHDFRVQRKMSQEELALASEIHPAYLGRLERGEKCPTVDTLYKVSQGLKIPLSELLNITAEINPSHTEAIQRIETALDGLSEKDAVDIAEIVEKIVAFRKSCF
ncbi:MAG: helix-turn-helix transcriptional regulator [Clostridia bacterium]|nr:helix-turn-helix transcriptional regulator [Clostridia bacterium]